MGSLIQGGIGSVIKRGKRVSSNKKAIHKKQPNKKKGNELS